MKLIKSKDLFDKIMSDLSTHEQFADFNFKAGSNRIIFRSKGFKKEVKILRYIDRHDSEMMIAYPTFGVKFDVLLKWLKNITIKVCKIKGQMIVLVSKHQCWDMSHLITGLA